MGYAVGDCITSDTGCKICGTNLLKVIAKKGRHFQVLTTTICMGCGLVHSYPIPTKEELDLYYSKQYRSDYKGIHTPKCKHILRYSRSSTKRLKVLLCFTKGRKKLLDVGSGSGEFIYLAALAGFDAQGLEPHEGYSKYTRQTFGASIITAPLESADIPEESYDIITLNHVLEHLQYPLTSLSILNRWLKKDGLLAVEVPNIETTQHSPTNRFHYAHIYNFNHDTLSAMLYKAGFDVAPHPECNGTTLFAYKSRKPDHSHMISMPENYQRLLHTLSKEVAREIYRKKKPFMRVLSKSQRYALEYIESVFIRDPKKIVNREFKKWRS